jgi:hypothetical protein
MDPGPEMRFRWHYEKKLAGEKFCPAEACDVFDLAW